MTASSFLEVVLVSLTLEIYEPRYLVIKIFITSFSINDYVEERQKMGSTNEIFILKESFECYIIFRTRSLSKIRDDRIT